MAPVSGTRGWLSVGAGTVFVAALAVWLFSGGTVELWFGLLATAAAVALVVLAVIGAVVERRPGFVLVTVAFLGVGLLLSAVVFGFAYLGESLTYVRGEATTASVLTCEEDGDDCVVRWPGGEGELELAFGKREGDTLPVHAHGDEAVPQGGLTVVVVAASAVAVVSPILALGTFLWLRRR